MPIIKPGQYRPGQPYRPGMLQDLADAARAAIPKRIMGRGRRLTRHGWEQEQDDETPGGVVLGIVTSAIAPRSGSSPNFTLGSGTATILDWIPGSPTTEGYSTTVYNRFADEVPASTSPVVFGVHPSGALIFINRDC